MEVRDDDPAGPGRSQEQDSLSNHPQLRLELALEGVVEDNRFHASSVVPDPKRERPCSGAPA
jgi:hypothetical protein